MKRITTGEEMKKLITEGKQRNFLWKKKQAKNLISDFTIIDSYNDKIFKFKEYCVIEDFPIREEIQQVSWDSISFKEWEVYLLDENESNYYTKEIMARKILEAGKKK